MSNESFLGSGSGGGGIIQTIDGDVGSVTGATISLLGQTSHADCGSTILFNASTATELDLVVTDGNANQIMGSAAGNSSISGGSNVAFGPNVLFKLTSASYNAALGYNALTSLTSGDSNSAFGYGSLASATTGHANTALGINSLPSITTGTGNIGIGDSSGSAYSTESSNIVIGNTGVAADANTIRIGSQGSGSEQQNKCFIAGITGVTTSSSNMVTVNTSTGQLGAAALPSGGAFVLIKTKTASNSVSIVFDDTMITSTYNRYQLIFDQVQPASNGGIYYFQISTNNGGAYIAANYAAATNQWSQTTGLWAAAQNANAFIFTNAVNTGNQDSYGTLYLQNFTSGSGFVSVQGQTFSNSTAFGGISVIGSYDGGTAVVNNIQILNSAGHISTGVFSLYGITQ